MFYHLFVYILIATEQSEPSFVTFSLQQEQPLSLSSASITQQTNNNNTTNNNSPFSLPVACPYIRAVSISTTTASSNTGTTIPSSPAANILQTIPIPTNSDTPVISSREYLVSLDGRSKLFVNGKLLSTDCNSFGVHEKFLVFTTVTNTIKFVRFADLVNGIS